ncbi:MAG: FAD-dependent oxidoreductase, partial [Enterobacterales bacterium]|nr:FAD-dependent oxidoreductase [Enterobacterales bacterium]
EVVSAREEGIEFVFHKQPTAIHKDGDKLSVKVTDTVSKEEITLTTDKAILAFGFRPNPPTWLTDLGLELDDSRRVKTYSSEQLPNLRQATSLADIYVGGDMSRGADLVVTAIADGRYAAEQMLADFTAVAVK